jgi:SAM-dependent methyltransferase
MEIHSPIPYPNGSGSSLDARITAAADEVRASGARRRERGELPPDEQLDLLQERVWAQVVAAPPVAAQADAIVDHEVPAPPDVAFTLDECDLLSPGYRIDWRTPVVGPAHAALRRQVNAEVRRYVDPALARQTRLNYRLTELVQRIVRDHAVEVQRLRDQLGPVGGLRMEVDALRAEVAQLQAELIGLHDEATGARDELRRLRATGRLLARAGGPAESPDAELPLDYLAYNERIGGGIEHERDLYAAFLPLFAGAPGLVVDLGCGRGPFLDLLRDAGIDHIGVDRSDQMVAHARGRGHRIIAADALEFLGSVEDGVLGGVFAAHLIEHLPRTGLLRLVEECQRTLAPGAPAVFISPDPRSLFVLSDTFYKDLTHVAPVHPAALAFLVEQAGFASHELRTLSPVPDARRLEEEEVAGDWSPALRRNLAKLEELIFGDLDYALVARR